MKTLVISVITLSVVLIIFCLSTIFLQYQYTHRLSEGIVIKKYKWVEEGHFVPCGKSIMWVPTHVEYRVYVEGDYKRHPIIEGWRTSKETYYNNEIEARIIR